MSVLHHLHDIIGYFPLKRPCDPKHILFESNLLHMH